MKQIIVLTILVLHPIFVSCGSFVPATPTPRPTTDLPIHLTNDFKLQLQAYEDLIELFRTLDELIVKGKEDEQTRASIEWRSRLKTTYENILSKQDWLIKHEEFITQFPEDWGLNNDCLVNVFVLGTLAKHFESTLDTGYAEGSLSNIPNGEFGISCLEGIRDDLAERVTELEEEVEWCLSVNCVWPEDNP